ncbi:MAG: hypothetical protein AAF657_19270 [Acidobacteriota bacterium]
MCSSDPEGLLCIQAIHVQWSKLARGAPLARQRNQVPCALPLSLDAEAVPSSGTLFHYSVYSEADAFAEPCFARCEAHPPGEIYRYDLVRMRPHGLALAMPHSTVRQTASEDDYFQLAGFGIPWAAEAKLFELRGHVPPSPGSRLAFALSPGQWGRLRWNRRSTVDAGTIYEQWTVNVAWVLRWQEDVFTAVAPSHRYEKLKNLW